MDNRSEKNRKPPTAYLLEGLMIFIAVTLGFFAESFRESISNHEKELEYVKSLISQLEQDTFRLTEAIVENEKKIKGLDSLLALPLSEIRLSRTRYLLYKYSQMHVTYYSAFISNDATMLQLKYSGGFLYLKRSGIADSIAYYDQVVRNLYAAEVPYAKAFYEATDALTDILNFRALNDTIYFKNGAYTGMNPPLVSDDHEKLEILFNKIWLSRGWAKNYVDKLRQWYPYTLRLIKLLKSEYGDELA